nr:hypothetical protein [Tanacetum cinerariifolium]
MLIAKEKLIKAIRTCLKNNNQPPEEKSIEILLAEESILTVMQTLEEKQINTEKYESFYDESDSASEIFNDDLAHIVSSMEYEYVYADEESDSGDLTTKMVDDIFDNSTRELYVHDKVFNPGILISKEEKSPPLLSHRGLKVIQLINDSESPLMIYGGDMPILDVPYLYFYPP